MTNDELTGQIRMVGGKRMNEIRLDRRGFLRLAGGTAALGSVAWAGKSLFPEAAQAAVGDPRPPDLYLGGTDGWIHLPTTPAIPPFHPDPLAPAGMTTYIFGFRNLTGLSSAQALAQKYKAQHSAPLFWAKQFDPANPVDFNVQLTNLGLHLRPDLFDAHTLHWHGLRNVIPFFDGEPSGSVSVPAGRTMTYVYRPRDPGTYMYHCHVEDVEHVHMGMTGLVFVRPLKGDNYLYNDPPGTSAARSTRFDREFAMFCSEVWAEAHWADAHIQLPEWSDYHADFAMLNGRVYPDTLAPNAPINAATSINALDVQTDVDGDLVPALGHPELKYQPHSSLVTCNGGDRVALRFANLGFRETAMTLSGIPMRVVGRDATPMLGRDGTDTSYETETINMGPGESYEALFTAPAYRGPGAYDTYMLYNRNFLRSNNLAPGGFGGQATEVRVYPANAVPAQTYPNDLGVSA